ncbi:MAG: uridine 5'-monophosphate synthase-like [Microgenomates group bacterium Gr01-1014_80]|nr:MAG: uridine 5'-monophosphate synthase-like [Microgenomates group bacterium Gr01-1014_80]
MPRPLGARSDQVSIVMTNLSVAQQALAEMLLETNTQAKVVRRYSNGNGKFTFEEIIRETHPIDFTVHPGEFVLKIHDKKPDAPLSPFYISLRNLPEELLTLVAKTIDEVTPKDGVDVCTGIPRAGIPLALEYSKVSGIPFEDVLEKTGEPGTTRQIVGKIRVNGQGKRLIIVDDLVTHAGTKLEAIKAAESLDYKVVGVALLFDREQGGAEDLRKMGYPVYSALKLSDTLDYYLEKGKISRERHQEIKDYLYNNI